MRRTRTAARSVELGSVAEINPAPPESALSDNEEISLLGMESVSEETGLVDSAKAQKISRTLSAAIPVRDGDILVANISSHFERGKIAILSGLTGGFGVSRRSFHVIRPGRRLSSRWLWYFMRQRTVREKAEQFWRVQGPTRQLSVEFLKELAIALPPLTKQKSIMGLLDNVTAARSLQKESILETQRIGSALFKEMFGDPDKNPKKWKHRKLSELVIVLPGAPHNTLSSPPVQDQWAVVTAGSVTSGIFKPDEALTLPQKASTQKPISKGDLLMSWTNESELVGTVALVEEDHDNLFVPSTLWKLTPKPRVSNVFLKELLSAPSVRQRIRDLATGTLPSKISQSKLLGLSVFQPPPQLQARFAKIYWELPELRRFQETLIADLDKLQASLLKRIFPPSETSRKERAAMKESKRVSGKKSSGKKAGRRVSAAQANLNNHRIIWDHLSSFQRDVWSATQTFKQPFRVTDLVNAVAAPGAKPVSRESIMISVELLVSLGVLIKEGRQDADRWRVPNPETDREIVV